MSREPLREPLIMSSGLKPEDGSEIAPSMDSAMSVESKTPLQTPQEPQGREISTAATEAALMHASHDLLKNDLDFSKTTLRKLYRRYDKNHDGLLDINEFSALVKGLDITFPSRVVHKLYHELDANHTGGVSEQMFLKGFLRLNKLKLSTELAKEAKVMSLESANNVNVRLIEYGCSAGHFRSVEVATSELANVLDKPEPSSWGLGVDVKWYDVTGLCLPLLRLFASHFGLHKSAIDDVGVPQGPKAVLFNGTYDPNSGPLMQIVAHTLSFRGIPIHENQTGDGFALSNNPKEPNLLSDQVVVFVIGDSHVISFRLSNEQAAVTPVTAPPTSSSLWHPTWRTKKHKQEPEAFRELWADVISEARTYPSEIRQKGAKYLTYRLLDTVIEHNWQLRDSVEDWYETLESEIRQNPRRAHITHIFDLQKSIERARNSMHGINAVAQQLVAQHLESADDSKRFFCDQSVYFRDLSGSVRQLQSKLEELAAHAKGVQSMYETSNNDKMNRVLYFLTLVTTLFIPGQFLTGVYGMNFEHMPELSYKYAYLIWWCVVVIMTSATVMGFRYLKLFV